MTNKTEASIIKNIFYIQKKRKKWQTKQRGEWAGSRGKLTGGYCHLFLLFFSTRCCSGACSCCSVAIGYRGRRLVGAWGESRTPCWRWGRLSSLPPAAAAPACALANGSPKATTGRAAARTWAVGCRLGVLLLQRWIRAPSDGLMAWYAITRCLYQSISYFVPVRRCLPPMGYWWTNSCMKYGVETADRC
jgi:hypothetical protein